MSKEPSQTREKILHAAIALFHEKGYAATGLAEILKRAEANSGSFYYFFRSKEQLLVAVLEEYERMLYPALLEPTWAGTTDPIERIFKLLGKYREALVLTDCTYGCPIGRLALEVDPRMVVVSQGISRNFDGWAAAVEKCLKDAQESGRLPQGIDLNRLAQFVLCVMEGGVMLSRSHRNPEPFDRAVEELRQYFATLQPASADSKESIKG